MTANSDTLLVAISNVEDSYGRRSVDIHILDKATHETLAMATMNGTQFGDFITCTSVAVDAYQFQLASILNGAGACASLTVRDNDHRRICEVDLTGEEFAAILGNKVTRVSGATIYRRAS